VLPLYVDIDFVDELVISTPWAPRGSGKRVGASMTSGVIQGVDVAKDPRVAYNAKAKKS
jgi:hypothetical protein